MPVIALALGSAACTSTPTPGPGNSELTARPAAALRGPAESLRAFLAEALPGESALVATTDGGPPLTVTVERDYHAASGKACRRLAVAEGDGPPKARVACRDEVGVWQLLPRLENLALPEVAAGRVMPGAGSAP